MAEETRRQRGVLWLVVPLGAMLVSGVVLLRPGLFPAVDVWPHLVRQQVVAETLKNGVWPFWTFMFYGGFPLLRFYGPLQAFVGGLLQLLVGDPAWALKIMLFILHGLSGWTMLLLLRRRIGLPAAGMGAAAYMLIPWRLASLLTEANLPQSLVYLLLPLVFVATDELRTGRDGKPGSFRRGCALFGLSVGLLLLAHPYYGALAGALGLTVVLIGRGRARGLVGFFIGLGAAAAMAAFFILPLLLEHRAHQYPVLPLRVPLPDLRVLLWPWSRVTGYRGFYFGLTIALGSLVTAVGAMVRLKRRQAETDGLLPFLAAFVFGILATWPAAALDLDPPGLPPGRALLLLVFACAGLVAFGSERLAALAGRRRGLVIAGLALLLAAESLPFITRVRHVTPERALPVRSELYQLIPSRPTPRVLDLPGPSPTVDDYPRLAVYPALGFLYGGLASPLGPPFHQFAPASMMYVYPWAALAAADLGEPGRRELSTETLKALALAGVTHVIAPAAEAGPGYVMTKQGIDWDDRFLRAERRPLLVFGSTGVPVALGSRVLRPVPTVTPASAATLRYAGDWRELLAAVDLDLGRGTISAIPVRGIDHDSLPGDDALVVHNWQVTHDRVRVVLEAASECWVRLAVSWYPYLDVRLDGEPVEHAPTADGFLYLRYPAGVRTLTVRARLGLLRTVLMPVSALMLVVCGVMSLLPAGRRRKKGA